MFHISGKFRVWVAKYPTTMYVLHLNKSGYKIKNLRLVLNQSSPLQCIGSEFYGWGFTRWESFPPGGRASHCWQRHLPQEGPTQGCVWMYQTGCVCYWLLPTVTHILWRLFVYLSSESQYEIYKVCYFSEVVSTAFILFSWKIWSSAALSCRKRAEHPQR